MTHADIMRNVGKGTYADYISLALANGWSKINICESMSYAGLGNWSDIGALVDRFNQKYSIDEQAGQ